MNSTSIKIIAEAGVNHNGSIQRALEMVREAAKAGADYIKFQTFNTKNLVTADCKTAEYQEKNAGEESQAEMLRKLELSAKDFAIIKNECEKCGIGFLSTPFDEESLDLIVGMNPDYIKVPSGEVTNLPYLRKVAATGIPVIISTGMCHTEDIKVALSPFLAAGYDDKTIILLHCTTQYPTPMEDVNLKAMNTMREIFGLPAGYSDHTEGIVVPIAAAALGAEVIEKHFTLSRNLPGPDHQASLEPDELCEMVRSIRDVEKALGAGEKKVTFSESKNIAAARRSIVAARHIPEGKLLEPSDLSAKRPGTGISPMMWDKVIGSKAKRAFEPDEQIEL